MMKKAISLLLALALILCMVPTAFAADNEATQAAQTLYELGLFKGTGANADGTPIFDLDKTPTRNQAIIMLVRLLGKEEEAQAGTWEIPFTDVTDAMKPYIGYAYANGLTNGTTATTYSGTNSIKANQYVTFVLRALGYTSGKDFTVSDPWDLASSALGVDKPATSTFTRGDVATISKNALFATVSGSGQTLFDKLKADGAIAQDASNPQQSASSVTEVPAGLNFQEVDPDYYGCWGSPLKTLTAKGIEYAVSGSYAYFRMRFQSDAVTKFFVQPFDWGFGESAGGEMLILDADAKSGVFTCKVPLSWFENYADLIISPSDDGHTGPGDYVIKVAYFLNDVDSLTYQTADYIDDSYEVADFKFGTAEYAEVPGGRMYRITFTNTDYRNIQFIPMGKGGEESWNISLVEIVRPQAGDTEAYYFVSDRMLEEYTFIWVRVRDAYSIDPDGGNCQKHYSIDIYFNGISENRR